MTEQTPSEIAHELRVHKSRPEYLRLVYAAKYSLAGLNAAWSEAAFRFECVLAVFFIPAAFWSGNTWAERAVLLISIAFVLATELLNTAIEAVVNLASPAYHDLAKRAKDVGSAAVFVAMMLFILVWGDVAYQRFLA